jgi:hypothetical protein
VMRWKCCGMRQSLPVVRQKAYPDVKAAGSPEMCVHL